MRSQSTITTELLDLLFAIPAMKDPIACPYSSALHHLHRYYSSAHGALGASGHSVYAGVKGAINAFRWELAIELCPLHIRVNVLAPGSVEAPNYFRRPADYYSLA